MQAVSSISRSKEMKVVVTSFDYTTSLYVRIQRCFARIIEYFRAFISLFFTTNNSSCNLITQAQRLGMKDIQDNLTKFENIYSVIINESIGIPKAETIVNNFFEKEENILVIPFIISKRFGNHIVFFAVNKNTQEIIFYDSKGWCIKDYNNVMLKNFANKLKQVVKNQVVKNQVVKNKYPDCKVVQNTRKDQYDTFNCGMYVLQRIALLKKFPEKSFDDLLNENPLTYSDVMSLREKSELGILRYDS